MINDSLTIGLAVVGQLGEYTHGKNDALNVVRSSLDDLQQQTENVVLNQIGLANIGGGETRKGIEAALGSLGDLLL